VHFDGRNTSQPGDCLLCKPVDINMTYSSPLRTAASKRSSFGFAGPRVLHYKCQREHLDSHFHGLPENLCFLGFSLPQFDKGHTAIPMVDPFSNDNIGAAPAFSVVKPMMENSDELGPIKNLQTSRQKFAIKYKNRSPTLAFRGS
jgi:hypothetical protein